MTGKPHRRRKRWPTHSLVALVLANLLIAFGSVTAGAKPLALNTCLGLWRQSIAARSDGTAALIAEGAEGAKERLSKSQLSDVKGYIERMERLKFQCRQFIPPPPSAKYP